MTGIMAYWMILHANTISAIVSSWHAWLIWLHKQNAKDQKVKLCPFTNFANNHIVTKLAVHIQANSGCGEAPKQHQNEIWCEQMYALCSDFQGYIGTYPIWDRITRHSSYPAHIHWGTPSSPSKYHKEWPILLLNANTPRLQWNARLKSWQIIPKVIWIPPATSKNVTRSTVYDL